MSRMSDQDGYGLGECDTCGAFYEVSSREGRCGRCGECADHCPHTPGVPFTITLRPVEGTDAEEAYYALSADLHMYGLEEVG